MLVVLGKKQPQDILLCIRLLKNVHFFFPAGIASLVDTWHNESDNRVPFSTPQAGGNLAREVCSAGGRTDPGVRQKEKRGHPGAEGRTGGMSGTGTLTNIVGCCLFLRRSAFSAPARPGRYCRLP